MLLPGAKRINAVRARPDGWSVPRFRDDVTRAGDGTPSGWGPPFVGREPQIARGVRPVSYLRAPSSPVRFRHCDENSGRSFSLTKAAARLSNQPESFTGLTATGSESIGLRSDGLPRPPRLGGSCPPPARARWCRPVHDVPPLRRPERRRNPAIPTGSCPA